MSSQVWPRPSTKGPAPVLERLPNLRVGFLEAGCGWVPYWLIDFVGTDRVVFASDSLHPDHMPDLTDTLVALEDRLSAPTLARILDDNARALYGA